MNVQFFSIMLWDFVSMWMAPPEFPALFFSNELLSKIILLLYCILIAPPLLLQMLFFNWLKFMVIPVVYLSKIVPKSKWAEFYINLLWEIVEFCRFILSNYRTLVWPPILWEKVQLFIFIYAFLFLFWIRRTMVF